MKKHKRDYFSLFSNKPVNKWQKSRIENKFENFNHTKNKNITYLKSLRRHS